MYLGYNDFEDGILKSLDIQMAHMATIQGLLLLKLNIPSFSYFELDILDR